MPIQFPSDILELFWCVIRLQTALLIIDPFFDILKVMESPLNSSLSTAVVILKCLNEIKKMEKAPGEQQRVTFDSVVCHLLNPSVGEIFCYTPPFSRPVGKPTNSKRCGDPCTASHRQMKGFGIFPTAFKIHDHRCCLQEKVQRPIVSLEFH